MTTTTAQTMDFGDALRAIKARQRVARAGWNGKGQFLVMIFAGNAVMRHDGDAYSMQDCIGLKNAQGDMQPGWAPSQGDLLAEDWVIVGAAKEEQPPLAKSARGYAVVDRRDTRTLAALKECAVSPPMPVSRNDLSFLVVHPSLREIEEGERIPTYRAAWADHTDSLVFMAGSE
jgi:hypothetical protein